MMTSTASMVAVLVAMVLVPGMVTGLRAPCYECEKYKESHPHVNPYGVVRSHCVYPCECGSVPDCPPGVPVIMDGCGCCWQCAREAGEPCNGATLCDKSRNLTCVYNSTAEPTGTCLVVKPAKCTVNNVTYEDGDTFNLDCRTQCTCKNATYACVSLCPGESLPPSAQCHHPHLVTVPGQCCREWMCDTAPGKAVGPPSCRRVSSRWSPCSHTCGAGVSVRWTTDNASCQTVNETRLCQLRPCQRQPWHQRGQMEEAGEGAYDEGGAGGRWPRQQSRKHHIRRGHECKATQRHVIPVRLRSGWCVSERRYRPKMCGECVGRCCTVHAATTITVPFLCPLKVAKGNRGAKGTAGTKRRYPRSLHVLLQTVLVRNATRSQPLNPVSPSSSPSSATSSSVSFSPTSFPASSSSPVSSPSAPSFLATASSSSPSSPLAPSSSNASSSPPRLLLRRRRSVWSPFFPTSASSSVYDMMDEGQPRTHDRYRYSHHQYNHHKYDPAAGFYYYQRDLNDDNDNNNEDYHHDAGTNFRYDTGNSHLEHDPTISLEQLQEEEDENYLPSTTTTTTWQQQDYDTYNNNNDNYNNKYDQRQKPKENDRPLSRSNYDQRQPQTTTDDLLYDLPLPHEDLTVEDDIQYDWVTSGEYEVVPRPVEWIIRCACSFSSPSSSPSSSSSSSSSSSLSPSSPCDNWKPIPVAGT
ncbi:uncharacterized protein LOC122254412 [Penaeus japonicus]|uniref:uncharacterized protein LOC122254412 n=1 Tax=Penaeus japonicus TaxID=27405 RepID=UPI001C7147F3|nr:uncharacterized protein LOC122254412 [Penaeus japonicus]